MKNVTVVYRFEIMFLSYGIHILHPFPLTPYTPFISHVCAYIHISRDSERGPFSLP